MRGIRTVDVARRPGALRIRITSRRRGLIILRLILCDRRADEGPSRGSRAGTNPRASTGSGRRGTYQRTGGRAGERAETGSLARGRFAGAKTSGEKNGGRDRWDKDAFS